MASTFGLSVSTDRARTPGHSEDQITGDDGRAPSRGRRAHLMGTLEHRQAWGKGAALDEWPDYYLRGHDQLMKYTKAGIEAVRRDLEGGASEVSKFAPAQSEARLAPYGSRIRVRQRRDPRSDVRKAGELTRQVLANEQLSPQVARLAIWLMSYVLVQERVFDGAFDPKRPSQLLSG